MHFDQPARLNGFLFVNKPKGITAYDVIRQLKVFIGKGKIGHSGTLDPFATGLMIIAIGKQYTKQLSQLIALDKSYEAEITLGKTTDTYDCTGVFNEPTARTSHLSTETITETIHKFIGTIEQQPPAYSAKKINGIPAYKLARQSKTVTLSPATITIYDIEIRTVVPPLISVLVHCSKGTYIRSLAHDIGASLGVGGHLSSLSRTRIGGVDLSLATDLNAINSDNIHQLIQYEMPN